MAFSKLVHVAPECGSSNGVSRFMKQLNKDRSLQKDISIQKVENAKSGFRTISSPQPIQSPDSLVREFFQQYETPSPIASPFQFQSPAVSRFQSPVSSPFLHPTSLPQSPLPQSPIKEEDWVHEFQTKTRISSSPPPPRSSSWAAEFLLQSPQQQQSNTRTHFMTDERDWEREFEDLEQTIHRPTSKQTIHRPTSEQTVHTVDHTIHQPTTHHDSLEHISFNQPSSSKEPVIAEQPQQKHQPTDRDIKEARAWHELGLQHQESERDEAAITAFETALAIDATCLDAWLALSISYTNTHRRAEAHRCLDQWILQHPRYRRCESLMETFLEAARVRPGQDMDPDVQVGLGVLLHLEGSHEKALDCFRAALVRRPNDVQLWNRVGVSLQKGGDVQGAMAMYAQAVEMDPMYIRARYNLAVCCMRLGRYGEAAQQMVMALRLQPDADEAIWNSLRLLMFMMNKDRLAQACIEKNLDAFQEF